MMDRIDIHVEVPTVDYERLFGQATAELASAVRAKGVDGIMLVIDAMSGTGMPDGEYTLGGLRVTVRGGEARR